MNTTNISRYMGAALLSGLLLTSITASAQGEAMMTTASPEGVSSEQITHMTATVTAVDVKARMVTLKGPEGNEMTLEVSDEVKRLGEIKAGDKLNVGYLQSIGLEFREANEEELKEPLKVTEESDKAAKDKAPAGAKLRTVRGVVTVEGMSRWLNTLTVRGPRGNYFVVEVEPDMVQWEELRIGRTMVATYTEALVMSIEPVAKKQ